MNTNDFPIDLDAVMEGMVDDEVGLDNGYLSAMFERQHQLMENYHEIERNNFAIVVPLDNGPGGLGDIDHRMVQMRLKDLGYRVVEELSEATNCLKNKPWKKDFVLTDQAHFYEEVADALHFFLEFCITAGMTPEDLARVYFAKSEVNKFRQRSNY